MSRHDSSPPPIKVAFVHQIDPKKAGSSWLGSLHFLKQTVGRYVGEVRDLGPAPISALPYRVAAKVIRMVTGKQYSYHHDPALGRRLGKYFSKKLAREKFDLVFAPAGAQIIPHLDTELPVIYYTDATWRAMRGYYSDYSNLAGRTAKGADELEMRALERSDIILYLSDWAARSAIEDYGIDRRKVFVNYLGANLVEPPKRADVLPRRLGSKVRLLMVGVSWEIKGGDLAYGTLLRLLDLGFDAELTVLGCTPPDGVSHPRLQVIPFLNKLIPEEWERFRKLWYDADLFILPTRFEAAGLVFCEANAYGLPAIATRTGGVPSIVRDGVNGFTLPLEDWEERSARLIASIVAEPDRYAELCESSRNEFEQRLSWDAWGKGLVRIIGERLPHLRERLRNLEGEERTISETLER